MYVKRKQVLAGILSPWNLTTGPADSIGAFAIFPEVDTPWAAMGVPGELESLGVVDSFAGLGFTFGFDRSVVCRTVSPYQCPCLR